MTGCRALPPPAARPPASRRCCVRVVRVVCTDGHASKMAALKEDRCYGLSCGRVSNGGRVSVLHVKLTDSALRALEGYRAGGKVSGER